MSGTSKREPISLKVLKRSGSTQPFEKNKLVNSIKKAGATPQQATLVSDRVINRLGAWKQPVPSSQLSTMVARSLGQVNPKASSQYTGFRNEKLAAKGAAFAVRPSAVQPAALKPVTIAAVRPTSILRPGITAPRVAAAPLQKLPPNSSYGRIAGWLKTKYGSRFKQGATTDEIAIQLTRIFKEDIEPRGRALQGFKNYIALRKYGDLVR